MLVIENALSAKCEKMSPSVLTQPSVSSERGAGGRVRDEEGEKWNVKPKKSHKINRTNFKQQNWMQPVRDISITLIDCNIRCQ